MVNLHDKSELITQAENGKVSIKNMATEEQKIIDLGELIDEIYNIIDEYGS